MAEGRLRGTVSVRAPELCAGAVAVATFCVYALTASRTIAFWEAAHYPFLARTLSIANPPGSLLLTLLGRFLGEVPFAWPMAYRLNLIAALIGAATAASLTWVGWRLARTIAPEWIALAGAAAAALVWAFAFAPWTYATQFTPYGLSALFSALILGAFLRWWRRAEDSDRAWDAALVGLLVGLDVSVHRVNLVLVPALVFGVLLRRPRALVRPAFLAAAAAAFALGAATQLLYIPMSLRKPFLDMYSLTTPAALWQYVRLEPIGGSALLQIWPRHADFVRVQLGDLASFTKANLIGGGWGWIVGLALVILGLAALARQSWRLALALLGFALAAGLGVVLFLNRPETYFRSLDRHYLPFLLMLIPLLACGVATVVASIRRLAGRAAALVAVLLATALPLRAALVNGHACDRSHTRFAETYARDALEPLPRGALLLTNGDNDSFPLWYLQRVEDVRADVEVINLPTTWTDSGKARVRHLDPALATFEPSDTLIADLARRILGRRPLYVAGTVPLPPPVVGLTDSLQLEGLSWRVPAPGDERHGDLGPLRAFVRERLPRAGITDARQRVEWDAKSLVMNYATAGSQLAIAQLTRGDARGTLETMATLERYDPPSGWPPSADQLKESLARVRRAAMESETSLSRKQEKR